MTDFTPGPWKVKKYGSYRSIHSDNDVSIAAIDPYNEQDAANAHLIAAAPDLLAAVEVALQGYIDILQADLLPDHKAETQMVVGTLDAALRKAKGEGDV